VQGSIDSRIAGSYEQAVAADKRNPPPDWQLPPGVDRGLWDYLHSDAIARDYDAALAGSSLFEIDQAFVERWCPEPGRLIDLGCGTGRVLRRMARLGHRVLGVDLSDEMLRQAAARAAAEGVRVELLRANLVELDGLRDGAFDYAACLFSTLGMVRGADNRRRVVGHAYRLLRPGGRFVLHVHNRWFNFWNPQGRKWLWRDLLSRGSGDRTMPAHQGVAGLTLHLFTRGEAVRILREAGFLVLEVRPVSLRADGRLRWAWWFGWLRAYGYLLAAERPG
jgi:SAM-dependent methyltransferase